ncbi:hypothetical protein [Planococcus maitriensis]|uniref:Uncharacterized protein n=1 Tax=Planococcus maitriensis TaxID=221799 RepID=A0A365K7Z4_9BACL|nr:hypothetical protein [Planococcus maitriensis]RAZ68314.1 hypothetical protein DP119_06500 [Planococcus maitriensis]
MRTSTILFIFLLVMHLLTVLNTLLFGGNLNDLVFWFNSALFMAALAVFVYRRGIFDAKTPPAETAKKRK